MGDLHSVGEQCMCSTNLARKVMDTGSQANLLDTSGLHREHTKVLSSFIAHPSVIILNQINANKIEWQKRSALLINKDSFLFHFQILFWVGRLKCDAVILLYVGYLSITLTLFYFLLVSGEGKVQVFLQVREGVPPTVSGEYYTLDRKKVHQSRMSSRGSVGPSSSLFMHRQASALMLLSLTALCCAVL